MGGKKAYSRPVNIDLYNEGLAINSQGISNADILWNNIKNHLNSFLKFPCEGES